jgi:hypothetical protein
MSAGRLVGPVRRREFLLAAAAAFATACSSRRFGTDGRARAPRADSSGAVELWSFFDLPAADPRSRELSGIAWDGNAGVLWAVQDVSPSLVSLVPDRDLRTWRFADTLKLEIDGPVDLEGLVIVPEGFIVSSEEGPRLIEVDRAGRYRRDIVFPAHCREARENKSLESLTLSPSGRYLFTTTEVALERDGASATTATGTRVRIDRIDRTSRDVSEHAYETDPLPYDSGDWGVADLAALSDTELLVLERGWSKGHGNTVRIYRTELSPRASCLGVERLSSTSAVLGKSLLVDLSKLVVSGLPEAKQPQASPLLDNYEGLALGPHIDGRPTLLVVSDDNGRATQFARVLVLLL